MFPKFEYNYEQAELGIMNTRLITKCFVVATLNYQETSMSNKHKMYYLDRFNRKVVYESHSYKELKEQMLEMSHSGDAGTVYYINPETNEERELCYYND